MTLKDTHNVTGLQGLADGQSPSAWPVGTTPDLFGQAVAPASHSAARGSRKAKPMTVTYGLSGTASLESQNLQSFLESRLAARLPTGGLTMFIKGWKQKVTPSGRRYCQLAVSAKPINGSGCSLWPTPQGRDWKHGDGNRALNADRSNDLNDYAKMVAMWPTPASRDWKDTGDMSESMVRKDGKSRMDALGRVTFGLNAQTGKQGQLSPAFTCWLMGYPEGYEKLLYTAMETQSSRK